MKKIISILLTLILCFGIVGCSGKSDEDDTKKSNTYKDAVASYEEWRNCKYNNIDEYIELLSCGLFEKELGDFITAFKKSDRFVENFEESRENRKHYIDDLGITVTLTIVDKEELSKEEGEDVLEEYALAIEDFIEEAEDIGYVELADRWECTKTEAENILKKAKALKTAVENAKVSKTYSLTIRYEQLYQGDTQEIEKTVCAYKINGTWVLDPSLSQVWRAIYYYDFW